MSKKKTRKVIALTRRQFEVLDAALRVAIGYGWSVEGEASEAVQKEREDLLAYLRLRFNGSAAARCAGEGGDDEVDSTEG